MTADLGHEEPAALVHRPILGMGDRLTDDDQQTLLAALGDRAAAAPGSRHP